MSSNAVGRKLNATEQKIHQSALADPKKTITPKECETLIPEQKARMDAINFLLSAGLLKVLKDANGMVLFRAVMKKEMEVKKDLSGEEAMVLSHIQASGNEGIWTKHIKAKTELHQTVIDRCLKSLTQKKLIKAVKTVKFPTRKIYMLYHLDPSVEMTGGPWYTDNELDTEFIKLLCSACLRFIRDRSLPKTSSASPPNSMPLYPIGAAPSYPTASQVLNFLHKTRITETTLEVEHVEMLLGVLVLDGEIERLPAFGAAMWESSMEAAMEDGNNSDDGRPSNKKRTEKNHHGTSKKRKRNKHSRIDTESDSEDEADPEDGRRSKSKSKSKSKKSRDDSDSESADESEEERKRKRKKRKRTKEDTKEEDEDRGKKRKRSGSKDKKRKRKSHASDGDSGSDSTSSRTASSVSDSEPDSRSRARSKSKFKGRSKRSPSPVQNFSTSFNVGDAAEYSAHVYRAIRAEHAGNLGLGQAPCTRCPSFEFCKPGGPVNPDECVYYGEWLAVKPGGEGKEGEQSENVKQVGKTVLEF